MDINPSLDFSQNKSLTENINFPNNLLFQQIVNNPNQSCSNKLNEEYMINLECLINGKFKKIFTIFFQFFRK